MLYRGGVLNDEALNKFEFSDLRSFKHLDFFKKVNIVDKRFNDHQKSNKGLIGEFIRRKTVDLQLKKKD